MTANLDEATRFLSRFNYTITTLQYLNRGKPKGCDVYAADQVPLKTLEKYNKEGRDIFFMVNEGDGELKQGKKYPRSKENVRRLTACFIDADGVPIETLKVFCKTHDIKPHIVVESSPGKFHFYFLLSTNTEWNSYSKQQWEEIQTALVYLDTPTAQADAQMVDYSRILRIPGFYHLKGTPFLTRVAYESDHNPYTLQELHTLTNAAKYRAIVGKKHYEIPKVTLGESERYPDMTSLLGTLLTQGVAPELAEELFYSHAKSHYQAYSSYLPGGESHGNVKQFIDWKLQSLAAEKTSAAVNVSVDLLSKGSSTNSLGDSFFLNAPGLVGEMTRELCKHAPQPIPSFAFAASICAVATLKSFNYVSEFRHAPANYFFCLAPTGSGKNFGKETIANVFSKLGVAPLITNNIRSVQGMYKFLKINGYKGLLLHDEAHHFFEQMEKSGSDYLIQCRSFLLEAYTLTNASYHHQGYVGARNDEPVILKYPRFNYLGIGIPRHMDKAFNERTLAEGTMPRFIVLQDRRPLVPLTFMPEPGAYKFEEGLRRLIRNAKLQTEADMQELIAIQQRIDATDDITEKQKLENDLDKKLVEPNKPLTVVPFSYEAKQLYSEYNNRITHIRNNGDDVIKGLYSRAVEQVGRIAISLADSAITDREVAWAIELIDDTLANMRTFAENSLMTSHDGKILSQLEHFIAEHMAATKKPVKKGWLYKKFKVRDSRELDRILNMALESGSIRLIKGYKDSPMARGADAYVLGELL